MSHLVDVKTQLKNIEALKLACQALGVELHQGGRARFYSGHSEECDYLINLPGRYDLGFKRQTDDTYAFVCDEELIGGPHGTDGYGRGDAGRKIIGENASRLRQAYSYGMLQLEARRKGLSISKTTLQDGRIRVLLSGRSL